MQAVERHVELAWWLLMRLLWSTTWGSKFSLSWHEQLHCSVSAAGAFVSTLLTQMFLPWPSFWATVSIQCPVCYFCISLLIVTYFLFLLRFLVWSLKKRHTFVLFVLHHCGIWNTRPHRGHRVNLRFVDFQVFHAWALQRRQQLSILPRPGQQQPGSDDLQVLPERKLCVRRSMQVNKPTHPWV